MTFEFPIRVDPSLLVGVALLVAACSRPGSTAGSSALKPIDQAALQTMVDTTAKELLIPGAVVLLRTPQGEFTVTCRPPHRRPSLPPRERSFRPTGINDGTVSGACQRVEDNAFHLYGLSDSVNSVQHLMQLEGIDHVAMGVRDIERSAKWYIEILGFKRLHEGMWQGLPTFVGKGNTGIALFPANEEPKMSTHREIRMLHLAFRANRKNFLAAQQELKKRGIKFEFQDHEIAHSIYFRDPDGHQLEITTYEVD